MATWFSLLLISLGSFTSFTSSNSFSSPSLFSLPVPFKPSSSPVVAIPIIEEAHLNQIPSESLLQPPFPFICPSAGYHRDPLSCEHFYICTDLWAVGASFQVNRLVCAPGTVWDEVLITCNWPHQVPYCAHQVEEEGNDNHAKEDESKVKEEEDTVKEEDEEDIVKEEEKEGEGEMFWSGAWSSHKCNAPGISPHPEQCSKFWLCRQLGEELQALLFQCPPNYQFNSTILRCSEAGETCQVGIAQWRTEEIGVFVLEEREMEKFFDAWTPSTKSLGQDSEDGFVSPTQSVAVLYDLR